MDLVLILSSLTAIMQSLSLTAKILTCNPNWLLPWCRNNMVFLSGCLRRKKTKIVKLAIQKNIIKSSYRSQTIFMPTDRSTTSLKIGLTLNQSHNHLGVLKILTDKLSRGFRRLVLTSQPQSSKVKEYKWVHQSKMNHRILWLIIRALLKNKYKFFNKLNSPVL